VLRILTPEQKTDLQAFVNMEEMLWQNHFCNTSAFFQAEAEMGTNGSAFEF
jgi:hypothetical protein